MNAVKFILAGHGHEMFKNRTQIISAHYFTLYVTLEPSLHFNSLLASNMPPNQYMVCGE